MPDRVVVMPEAEVDLEGACEWYESRELGLSDQFLERVNLCFESVRQFPEMFEVVRRRYQRAFVQKFPYVVYFKVEGDVVEIHAVLHGKRSPWHWQQRLR